ncbi:MAG: radical SAM protein [bacterium]|nr:radical SAM protein [bacterium]
MRNNNIVKPKSRMKVIAWETTRRCEYKCKHCRASAVDKKYDGELNTEESKKLIDSLAENLPAILILTGGEPLFRDDIYELASYASLKKIRVVMATCGANLNSEDKIKRVMDSGISRISLSLDGSNSETHDSFRGRPGAFEEAVKCAEFSNKCGLEFQINSTVSKLNVDDLENINNLSNDLGAVLHDIFLLVPTGRAKSLTDIELDADKYEETLRWIAKETLDGKRNMKVTCAPHYSRIWNEYKIINKREIQNGHMMRPNGCLAGGGFVFVSYKGDLQPCGFFDVPCGNIRDFSFNFNAACQNSDIFKNIALKNCYSGKCGKCEYWTTCGGCRARAMFHSDDYLAEEPYCSYIPDIN